MRALCIEIDALTPALYSLDPAPAVRCDRPAILAKAYASAGDVFVVAVNTQMSACDAKFTVPSAEGALDVLFEGRTVSAIKGAWRDRLGSYERRVYRFRARR
jgi:hypothetical protein